MIVVRVDGSFETWRRASRDLLGRGVHPAEVSFADDDGAAWLPGFAAEPVPPYASAAGPRGAVAQPQSPRLPADPRFGTVRVPAAFLSLARRVACHRDPSRWHQLYAVLFRIANSGAHVLGDPSDVDVAALDRMALAIRSDVHRAHALVRFRRIANRGHEERYVAFHRPEHRTLRLAAPFFARRYAAMRWSILTPFDSAHWDGARLTFGPGVPCDPGASDDAEALWRTFYAATFNPARANPRLLRAHLPERHWATLPEGRDIAALIRSAAPQSCDVIRRLPTVPTEPRQDARARPGGTPDMMPAHDPRRSRR